MRWILGFIIIIIIIFYVAFDSGLDCMEMFFNVIFGAKFEVGCC